MPRSAGHPFYARLNHVLDEAGFDAFVEEPCAKFYADGVSRPSLPPGRYFRMLLLGYFEGLESERAMAWRAADSLSLRRFQDIACTRRRPITRRSRGRGAGSTSRRTRRSSRVLQRVADAGLLKGKTVGIDAPTLEANAALRSIVRRDTWRGLPRVPARSCRGLRPSDADPGRAAAPRPEAAEEGLQRGLQAPEGTRTPTSNQRPPPPTARCRPFPIGERWPELLPSLDLAACGPLAFRPPEPGRLRCLGLA